MLKYYALEKIKNSGEKIFRIFIVSTCVWICALSFPDTIDTPLMTDKLIQSVYYGGRKTSTISYDNLKKKGNSTYLNLEKELDIIENYYANYINQLERETKIADPDDDFFIITDNELEESSNELRGLLKFKNETNKNNPNEDKAIFVKTLYTLYGNRTIFNLDLEDLEKMVNLTILTDGQAVIFWESLLKYKTDRLKSIHGRAQNEIDYEYYLFNIMPLKATGLLFFTFFIFLFHQKIQSAVIKNFFVYNLLCIFLTFYLLDNLFSLKYYISSFVMFIQFGFTVKYLLDSILSNFGFNKDDYDIFQTIRKTKTVLQFSLKLCVFSITTLVIGLFTFYRFQYILNYILFYLCLVQQITLIAFFFQYEAPPIFQPLKNFIFVFCGLGNFLLTTFHRQISRFSANSIMKEKADSFYIISECFSFVCISYLYDYLYTQVNQFSHLFCERGKENDELSDKISNLVKNFKKQQKRFTSSEDGLWIVLLLIGFIFSFVGLVRCEYLTFIFSLHYFKMVLKVFGRLFKIKLLRCVYCYLLFLFLLINNFVTQKNDNTLFESCSFTSTTSINFIKFLAKMIGIVYIIIIIFVNFEFVYMISNPVSDYTEISEQAAEQLLKKVEISASGNYTLDKRKKKRLRTIEIQVVKEDKTKFNLRNIVYVHFDLFTNYSTICLIFYIIKEIEKNYFVIAAYSLILLILLIRIYFIINEFRNDYEFLYAFFMSYLMGIRLITINRNYPPLYTVSCFYMFFLTIFYCAVQRRKIIVTLSLIFHLFSACMFLNSNFFFFLILAIIILPWSFKNSAEEKRDINNNGQASFLNFFIPALIMLCFQLYGFKNVLTNFHSFNESLILFLKGFDLFGLVQSILQGNMINEYSIVGQIYDHIANLLK